MEVYLIKFIFKHSKYLTIVIILISILRGGVVPLNIFVLQRIIDTVVDSSNFQLRNTFCYILIFLGIQVGSILLNQSERLVRILINNKLELSFGKELLTKCGDVEYKYFEEKEIYPIIERLINKSKGNLIEIVDIISIVIMNVISIGGIFYYIFKIKWWILFILIFTALPVWIFSVKASLRENKAMKNLYPYWLKSNYISKIINSREYAKESRLYNFFDYANSLWVTTLKKYQHGQVMANLKPRSVSGIFIIIQYAVVVGILFTLTWPLKAGEIKIGIFIALAEAMFKYTGNLQYEIISIIRKINNYKIFYKDYKTFFSLKEIELDKGELVKVNKKFKTIEFKDVWFSYSDEHNFILKGVNLTISCDEVVALVGKNGSGKTTIIKLLLGLLQPTKGEILVDNVSVSNLSAENRKEIFSAIFQDFARYSISLRENIGLSNLDNIDDDEYMKSILETINPQANLMKNLEAGFDTRLGKEIDGGMDLSGGQWQTVAIARALFSDSSCVIMDEPTAALDPIAEAEVYKQLMRATCNRAAIFITHRLGSTRIADTIYALDNGVIVESGSHEDLIERNGVYAELFNTQKKWYE